jgi:hypothetical protein
MRHLSHQACVCAEHYGTGERTEGLMDVLGIMVQAEVLLGEPRFEEPLRITWGTSHLGEA